MRFLANENVPGDVVAALAARGHDVLWARTGMPGGPDSEILSRASREGRVLVTLDKDFGDLAFHAGLPAESGIILFRTRLSSPAYLVAVALSAVDSGIEFRGQFTVVEDDRLRTRPLPRR